MSGVKTQYLDSEVDRVIREAIAFYGPRIFLKGLADTMENISDMGQAGTTLANKNCKRMAVDIKQAIINSTEINSKLLALADIMLVFASTLTDIEWTLRQFSEVQSEDK